MDGFCFQWADTLKIFSSEIAWPNGLIFNMEVLYRDSSFCPVRTQKKHDCCGPIRFLIFWCIRKPAHLKLLGKWISICGRSFMKFLHLSLSEMFKWVLKSLFMNKIFFLIFQMVWMLSQNQRLKSKQSINVRYIYKKQILLCPWSFR